MGTENQSANISRPSVNDLNSSTLAQIAQYVASSGQTLNIADVKEWVNKHHNISTDGEIDSAKAILCMPIVNAQKHVVGVAQLINKVSWSSYSPYFYFLLFYSFLTRD